MSKQYVTLPNLISLSRILLILPIFILLQKHLYTWAFALATFTLFTDFIDGLIARKTNSISVYGSILDPIADKIFVFSLLFFFTYKGQLNFTYFAISSTRDILQLAAVPILMGYKKIKFSVQPKLIPKIATTLKYIIIMILFLGSITHISFKYTLSPILITSAILEIYVLYRYIIRFGEIFKGVHNTFE